MKKFTLVILLLIFLSACSASEEITPTAIPATNSEPVPSVPEEQSAVVESPTSEPEMMEVEEGVDDLLVEETAVPEIVVTNLREEEPLPTETPLPAIETIEVTYFTPSQQEGPYYTVDKPEDRDNDLVDFAGTSGAPGGEIVEFGGKVYDAAGQPIEGLTIEIWQTDVSGVYLHPGDPGTASRDPNFQFYGEATTEMDGGYTFRTILPGRYEPRPRHIHFKMKLDGRVLLTSQFYFAGEADSQGIDTALLIDPQPGQDAAGDPIFTGRRDIVLNTVFSD